MVQIESLMSTLHLNFKWNVKIYPAPFSAQFQCMHIYCACFCRYSSHRQLYENSAAALYDNHSTASALHLFSFNSAHVHNLKHAQSIQTCIEKVPQKVGVKVNKGAEVNWQQFNNSFVKIAFLTLHLRKSRQSENQKHIENLFRLKLYKCE